jgi:hypothetical protein
MNQWQVLLHMVHETDLDVVMLAGRWTLVAGLRTAAEVETALRLLAESVPEAAWAELAGKPEV